MAVHVRSSSRNIQAKKRHRVNRISNLQWMIRETRAKELPNFPCIAGQRAAETGFHWCGRRRQSSQSNPSRKPSPTERARPFVSLRTLANLLDAVHRLSACRRQRKVDGRASGSDPSARARHACTKGSHALNFFFEKRVGFLLDMIR
jgi:hypothetical protein